MAEFIRTIRLAMKSLMLHKLRSGLTMLGIVFGVFSVIAMLAIGEGASAQAQKQVLQLGATNIIVRTVKPPQDDQSSGSNSFVLQYGLLRKDFDILRDTLPTVSQLTPIREMTQEARFLHRTINARIVGCTPEYREMNHLTLALGDFLADYHQQVMANVCVIGSEVARRLFPYEDPLGQSVQVNNLRFVVIGVMRARTASAAVGGSLSGQDFNKDIYIPIRTFQVRFGDTIIKRSSGSMSGETVELNQITLKVRDREDVIPTAETVRESLAITHGDRKDYDIVVPLELLKQADQIRMIFNVVLGSIAAISLIVGGIGIMNIMLATVTERTREIGIRRALGARQGDIIRQFLTETIVLSGAGGLIGILLGLLTPFAFQALQFFLANFALDGGGPKSDVGRIFSDMQPQIATWSLPLAFGISVGIGVAFGIYPARSAARMDPIEALRHE
jgi:putative ABC transport system permease protein